MKDPHVSFTKHERLQKLFADSIDGQYETLHTKVNNYWKGHWVKHPAQVNLYGLPPEVIVNVIRDFVEAQQKPITARSRTTNNGSAPASGTRSRRTSRCCTRSSTTPPRRRT